jgi:tRNA 2-thiocytidine biosynthesis protein TtcA
VDFYLKNSSYIQHNFKLPPRLNRKIGQAMHDYAMLADGDRVMVGVSGGIDSLTLAWMLKKWQEKAPICFDVVGQIIDNGFWRKQGESVDPEVSIGRQLEKFSIDYAIDEAWKIDDEGRTCFQCARNRRSQLFDLARERGFNKIAFGHHKDDLIETFFLNILYSGNISTMLPRQKLFGGALSVIRPFAYIEKKELLEIATSLKIIPVANLCPLADKTRREKVRELLDYLYREEPGAKNNIFAALANVRRDYML